MRGESAKRDGSGKVIKELNMSTRLNPFEQAQIEVNDAEYRKKVDRVKDLLGQASQAEQELKKAQEKYEGIQRALNKARSEV
jgi:hypothetical protein